MDQKLITDILQAEIQVGKKIKQHQNNLKQFNEFNPERAFEQLKKFSINSFNTNSELTQSTLKNSMAGSVQGIAYKGVIDSERLLALYRQQDELVTPIELQSIIQRYSSAANQGLDYDAFLRMIGQNLNDTKKKNLIFDSSLSQNSKISKTLSERVMQALSSIFLLELDLLRFTELYKVSLKNNFNFEPLNFFSTISFNSSGIISFEYLQQFFRRNGQEISQEDYLILLNRIKKFKQRESNEQDEYITQQEFVQLVVPQLPYNSKLSMAQLRASQSQGNLVQSEYVQAQQKAQMEQTKQIYQPLQFQQEGVNSVLKQSPNEGVYRLQIDPITNNGQQILQSNQKVTNNNNIMPINNNIAQNKLTYAIPVVPLPNQQQLNNPQQIQYQQQYQPQQQQLSPGVVYIPPQNVGYYPVQYAENNIITTPQFSIQQNQQQQQIQQFQQNPKINNVPEVIPEYNNKNAQIEAMNGILKIDNEKLKAENINLQKKVLQIQLLEQRAKDKEALRAEIIAEQNQLIKQQQEQQQQQQKQQQQQQQANKQQQIKLNPVIVQQQPNTIINNIPVVVPLNQGLVQNQQLQYQQQLPQVIRNQNGMVTPATFARQPVALTPATPVMATSMQFTPQQPINSQIIANQLVAKTSPPANAPLPDYILNPNQAPSFLVGGQQFNNRPLLENGSFPRGLAPHYNPIQGDLREAIKNQFAPPQQLPFIQQQNNLGFGQYPQF